MILHAYVYVLCGYTTRVDLGSNNNKGALRIPESSRTWGLMYPKWVITRGKIYGLRLKTWLLDIPRVRNLASKTSTLVKLRNIRYLSFQAMMATIIIWLFLLFSNISISAAQLNGFLRGGQSRFYWCITSFHSDLVSPSSSKFFLSFSPVLRDGFLSLQVCHIIKFKLFIPFMYLLHKSSLLTKLILRKNYYKEIEIK